MKSYVKMENVGISFDATNKKYAILKNINLDIKHGEFVSVIGHLGCGKSTMLKMIAGLINATEGLLLVNNREIDGPGPDRAVVFQNHSLLPWLTCFENVLLAIESVFTGENHVQQQERAYAALASVGLSQAVYKKPYEISDGMKQRVGIARALAMEPKLLLLDEPFAALDALTRAHLQDELMDIIKESMCTALMVTHDVDEAILLSDRIVMMTNGPAATIGKIFDVDLKKTDVRTELAKNNQYIHLRSDILKFLHQTHLHQEVA